MAETLDIAIVIPAYNAAEFLRETLGAVKRVDYGGELIVIDGGSTDVTSDLAREFGARLISLSQREGPARDRCHPRR